MVIRGPVDTEVFRAYTSQMLVPTLHPGDIVVLDNLSAHNFHDANHLTFHRIPEFREE
jgi:hypothetical protein